MSRLTLLHRDLSRRIDSLKQIVDASQKRRQDDGEAHSIDLNPNTRQLILKHAGADRKPKPQRGETLDEGFESDADTISLVSTESTISLRTKCRESDSANGSSASSSSSSDSDDSDGKNQPFAAPTERFDLVNCVCYTDCAHPDVLILVVAPDNGAEEETLVFAFDERKALEAFHENFSAVKAVASQKARDRGRRPAFNLLQRTDADGMTHIRIAGQASDDAADEEFASLLSLPNVAADVARPRVEKFATLGKQPARRRVLKKSKSIEDLLDAERPLRKVWNSAENVLEREVAPKAPPRKGRKKGPAPPPPVLARPQTDPGLAQNHRTLSKSFTSLCQSQNDDRSCLGLGNVFQGQYVRVQVAPHHHARSPASCPLWPSVRQRTAPAIVKHEPNRTKAKSFDAFKFSDPKNVAGYRLHAPPPPAKHHAPDKSPKRSAFAALKLYIPMYRSATKAAPTASGNPAGRATSATLTNRLFGMSGKLREFGALHSACDPNGQENPGGGRFLDKLGRLGRSGSLGNLTLLAHGDQAQGGTLKSVIKKRSKDEEDGGRRFGRHAKKVTFSAYNTVQVV